MDVGKHVGQCHEQRLQGPGNVNEHQLTKRGEPESTRPNIVLIVVDQHRRDHRPPRKNVLSPHTWTDSPKRRWSSNVCRSEPDLYAESCNPATGRMPSVHGTRFNGLPLDDRYDVHAVPVDAGYRTGLIGKLHLQNMGDHPEIAAAVVDRTLCNDAVSMPPTGWTRGKLKTRYDDPNGEHDIVPGWYGFEHAELAIDHGDVVGGHYALWLRDQGVDPVAGLWTGARARHR